MDVEEVGREARGAKREAELTLVLVTSRIDIVGCRTLSTGARLSVAEQPG